ncbi:unnamed protein product, partial [marine sediment metagenome]
VADTSDVTDMSDEAGGWKHHQTSFKSWTATVECNLPTTGAVGTLADELGRSAALAFKGTAVAGPNYGGTAFCMSIGPAQDVTDIGKITFTFQGDGVLAET